MSRSKWKGFFLDKKIINQKLNSPRIWSRRSVITSNFINKRVLIYNGKNFIPIHINNQKIGFKFGEFSFTRRPRNKSKVNTPKTKKK
jgi:small subunit ribosomal protein S19